MIRARRRSGAVIAMVAGLVVVVALGAAVLVPCAVRGDQHAAGVSTASRTASPVPTSRAGGAAAALAQLTTHPERLVPSSLHDTVQPAVAVPAGTKVSAKPSTWVSTGPRSGTMQVVLTNSGGAATTYLAVMVQENGSWRVLETEPLS